jgi:hypothetical protein
MDLETKLERIEKLFDKTHGDLLSLETELDTFYLQSKYDLTEDSIATLDELNDELSDISLRYQAFWDWWTEAHTGEKICEYSDEDNEE